MKIHLEDCSGLWEEYIQDASESIVVFTPYFDRLLVELFSSCELPYSEIYLVTQIDRIDSRPENLNRLDRIVQLVNLGVNVSILDRLHAKVLIVDDEHAFFGSQNFTKYSTESLEISTQISRYEDDLDEVFDHFSYLLIDSEPITQLDIAFASGALSDLIAGNEDEDEDEDEDD